MGLILFLLFILFLPSLLSAITWSVVSASRYDPPSFSELLIAALLSFILAIMVIFMVIFGISYFNPYGLGMSDDSWIGKTVVWASVCLSWIFVNSLVLYENFKHNEPSFRIYLVGSLLSLPWFLVFCFMVNLVATQ